MHKRAQEHWAKSYVDCCILINLRLLRQSSTELTRSRLLFGFWAHNSFILLPLLCHAMRFVLVLNTKRIPCDAHMMWVLYSVVRWARQIELQMCLFMSFRLEINLDILAECVCMRAANVYLQLINYMIKWACDYVLLSCHSFAPSFHSEWRELKLCFFVDLLVAW